MKCTFIKCLGNLICSTLNLSQNTYSVHIDKSHNCNPVFRKTTSHTRSADDGWYTLDLIMGLNSSWRCIFVLMHLLPGLELALWQYGLWRFQTLGTKLERFLPRNQRTQRKLLNFENWISGEMSKIEHNFSK